MNRRLLLILGAWLAVQPLVALGVEKDSAPRSEKAAADEDAPRRSSERERPAPRTAGAPVLPELPQVKRHRYAFVGGGVLFLGALAFSYSAQGEARRGETVSTAREARESYQAARQSAGTASVLYGLATATLLYAAAMELLPQETAQKASLTYHF